jgi:hypothetical protein
VPVYASELLVPDTQADEPLEPAPQPQPRLPAMRAAAPPRSAPKTPAAKQQRSAVALNQARATLTSIGALQPMQVHAGARAPATTPSVRQASVGKENVAQPVTPRVVGNSSCGGGVKRPAPMSAPPAPMSAAQATLRGAGALAVCVCVCAFYFYFYFLFFILRASLFVCA